MGDSIHFVLTYRQSESGLTRMTGADPNCTIRTSNSALPSPAFDVAVSGLGLAKEGSEWLSQSLRLSRETLFLSIYAVVQNFWF